MEQVLASRRTIQWDGIPPHTELGNAPIFLLSCLSARTAREYALPTSDCLTNLHPLPVWLPENTRLYLF